MTPSGSASTRPAELALEQAATLLTQPQSLVVLAGNTAAFSVTALGNGLVSFQWTRNGTNVPGATNTSLALSNVQAAMAGVYVALVTDAVGTVASQPATLGVVSKPGVSQQPRPEFQVLSEGEDLRITAAVAVSEPFACRWLLNSVTAYPYGFFGAVLEVPGAPLTNGGAYKLAVTNALGNIVASSNAYVTIVAPPVSASALLGGSLTLTGRVCGPTSLTVSNGAGGLATNRLRYGWFLNNTWIQGGTNASVRGNTNILSLTNIQASQAGWYEYRVSDVSGATTSYPALVSVVLPFPAPVVRAARADSAVLLCVPTAPGVSYTLQRWSVLPAPQWSDFTNTFGDGQDWLLTEPVSDPAQFYRVHAR